MLSARAGSNPCTCIRRRVHGGKEAEVGVAGDGGGVAALRHHQAPGRVLQQAGDALQGLCGAGRGEAGGADQKAY